MLKLHLFLLYEEFVETAVAARGYPGKQAPRGTVDEFVKSLSLDVPKHVRDTDKYAKNRFNQWKKDGRKFHSLAGRSWQGRGILALVPMRTEDAWSNKMDAGRWVETWEDSPRMRLLNSLGTAFVRAWETQGDVERDVDGELNALQAS